MNDLDIYLDTLFKDLTGLVYSPIKKPDSWEQSWFEYPSQREALVKHIENGNGDVYISPAIYSERKANKESVKKIQTVWVEFDGNEKIDFLQAPLPTLVVQTSFASHSHCYWKIKPASGPAVEDVNRRLTYYLKADSSGWDYTQLLRPPGTFNHKRQLPVVLSSSSESFYTLDNFQLIPKVSAPPSEIATVGNLLSAKDVLKEHQLPIKLAKMVTIETPKEPYRSSFLARLANELAEEELSHLEIVSLLKEADNRIEKYSGRSDQLIRLSQIADYAIHKHIVEDSTILYTPEQILNHVDSLSWILPNWLHTTGQLMLSSAPGVGKTQFCMELAYCLTVGERFLGMLAPMKHKVGVFSLEMDVRSLKYIFEHQRNEWNSLPDFIVIDESSSLKNYENIISENELSVVIIDSLSELFDDSSDNPNAEARKVMKWCRKIRRRYGVAIVLIHHNRKATDSNKKPKGLGDLYGSFQFGKDSDTVLQLWEDHKGIELSGVKVRFGPKEAFMVMRNKNLWFTREKTETSVSNRTSTIESDRAGTKANINFGLGLGNEHNK